MTDTTPPRPPRTSAEGATLDEAWDELDRYMMTTEDDPADVVRLFRPRIEAAIRAERDDHPIDVDADRLWDAMWEDLRHHAMGRPSGLAIIAQHRPGIESALAAVRAASPLDEALRAAEAALPKYWALHLGRNPSGTRYDARAKEYGVWPSNGAEVEAEGDTAAAALQALALALGGHDD